MTVQQVVKAYNHNAEPRAGHVAPSLKYYCANSSSNLQNSKEKYKARGGGTGL